MDNYDNYGYGVSYGGEYTDGFGEGEDTTGGAGSSSTVSVGGGSVSVGGGSVSVGGSSVSGGGGSISVSGSAVDGGGSASAGAGAGAGTDQTLIGKSDLDVFKEESITDLPDSELDQIYSDYKDYYSEVDDKVLPAKTDNYQVALRAHVITIKNHNQAQLRMLSVNPKIHHQYLYMQRFCFE